MLLLVYYVVFMLLANVVTYFIGLVVERWWGSQASLVVFLALYFFSFWLVWMLAVWMTKPKGVPAKADITATAS
jgi:hypothetical protein